MTREPRVVLAVLAHLLVIAAAIRMIAGSALPQTARIAAALAVAALLLPGLRTLLAGRIERFARLALLLVLIIGVGLVEVFATRGGLAASILLGAAMLEFAVLFAMTRPGSRPGRTEPKRQ
jgi:hypothetical protein